MKKEKVRKITFFQKDPITCPVCSKDIFREELFSGSGRLIAGNLTDELRRLYEPSKKYGEIFPLIYPVTVCPYCYYGVFAKDFSTKDEKILENLKFDTDKRKSSIEMIIKELDFKEPRRLQEGIASYYLAIVSYEHFTKHFSPTIKCGISALRAAWLFQELHRKNSDQNYDYLSLIFYRKARFYYTRSIELEQTGKETMSNLSHLGPDMDKNYGYDGALYIAGLLEYKYGPSNDSEKRLASLTKAKQIIGRVHGMGKASKSKPSTILEKAKEIYTLINTEVKKIKGD